MRTAQCAAAGDECAFVALPGGQVLMEKGPEEAAACGVEALGGSIEPPYRALMLPRGGGRWATGAVGIEVFELPVDTEGMELELVVDEDGARTLTVDGESAAPGVDALERAAGDRFASYVLRARRLEGLLWEIEVHPL